MAAAYRATRFVAALALACLATPALAWIYPEHREIAVLAVQGLDPERRAVFDRLWQDARADDEKRLCTVGADAGQGVAPECIDWAALPGIAGDHSCSSSEMLETVRTSSWILVVADVAAQLKSDLARIPVTASSEQLEDTASLRTDARRRAANDLARAQRVNALRTADTRMQRADPQYATRADANLAHFLLARPGTELGIAGYAELASKAGSEMNAFGVYGWHHLSALQKAARLRHEQLAPEERRTLARSILFDEAFALHFLQDMWASGHVAGSWGDTSQRKGTHDFYNQNGLEVFTWRGRDRTIVLMGDAHMRPEDAELAAKSVRTSLEQILDTASGRSRGYEIPHIPTAPSGPEALDICKRPALPERPKELDYDQRYVQAAVEVLVPTPVPGLGPGLGSLPRSRSEVGPFVGLAGTIDARSIDGGFVDSQSNLGAVIGLDVGLRVGLGLEGALGDAGDGLVFAQVGLRADARSSNNASDLVAAAGIRNPAIPSRGALTTRFRAPYYLIPGDLLLLSPMYWFDPARYTGIAVTAVNGGLLGWQSGYDTRFGRFQFVLGRELGVDFYGIFDVDQVWAESATPGGIGRAVDFKSVRYDFPILEYRPYRAFAAQQSSSVLFQLFGSWDVPYGEKVTFPAGAPSVGLDPIWSIGLRMVFDWRYYW